MVTCSEDSQYWHVMYAAKTIHTESSSAFSKAGLVTYDATCKSCHGENFIDEIIVTGVRFVDEVIVTGVRIDRDDGNILDTSRIPGLDGGFGGPGAIGGDYEDEEGDSCGDTPTQQKNGATKQAGQCTPPETPVTGRPCSSNFWNSYLDYDRYAFAWQAWDAIGGSTRDRNRGEQSCAVRLSCGLNGAGAIIPSISEVTDINSEGPNNGVRFILRARDLRAYIIANWGDADLSNVTLATVRNRLAPGQLAIHLTDGHAGVVTATYNDPSTSGGDFWLLPTCP